MGKFKMPTIQQFLDVKRICDPKRDPVWVYLEKEMRENIDKKPYNDKVGTWLRFLKDLKYYHYCEGKRKQKRLIKEIGPYWYFQLSSYQIDVLNDLKANIRQDLQEDRPTRTRKSLSNLGLTLKIPRKVLMNAMNDCMEDPGVFIWSLYYAVYKITPSELRGHYDLNSMILMSSLVFIDLHECVDMLEKLTQKIKPVTPKPKKKPLKNDQPNTLYGEYLQKCYVPKYSNHSLEKRKKRKTSSFDYKFRLRSQESYEKLCQDHSFLNKRKERNIKEKYEERICEYKFWEPPSAFRNSTAKEALYAMKLKMIKKKAKAKYKAPYKNTQYQIGGVAFAKGKPHYILTNVKVLQTAYIPINGGIVIMEGECITTILGFWKFPRKVRDDCDESCDCLTKWDDSVMSYLKKSKCKCGHYYDFKQEGKPKEKYFYPPTRHGSLWTDHAKIYQMDPTEDFIKDSIKDALSSEATPKPSKPMVTAAGLSEEVLLAALLADLSDTALIIPHLPQANLLNNLQEWVRKRVKGKLTRREHNRLFLQSQRRWMDLKHIDFKARPYRIPFTLKQMEHMTWSHYDLIKKLAIILVDDFISRNKMNQVNQTRLWWSTTKYDAYPCKSFLDIFFTYMPGRLKDTFLINPYNAVEARKHIAKTCRL